jgi:hypothetical protein
MKIEDAYKTISAAVAADEEKSIDELRKLINDDPSVARAFQEAMERSAIPGFGVAGKMIPG